MRFKRCLFVFGLLLWSSYVMAKEEVRNSVKIILLNKENKILLMGTDDKNIKDTNGKYKGRFWQLIGGKIEEGESLESAAKRELFEETSLQSEDVEFGPIVWQGDLSLLMHGTLTKIHQKFIVAHLKKDVDINLNHLTEEEKGVVITLQWWSLKEIENSKEIIYPGVLAIHLKELLGGDVPDSPIEIDLAESK